MSRTASQRARRQQVILRAVQEMEIASARQVYTRLLKEQRWGMSIMEVANVLAIHARRGDLYAYKQNKGTSTIYSTEPIT